MKNSHQKTYLKDYTPPDFQVDSIDLHFNLLSDKAVVTNRFKVKRIRNHDKDLFLNGEHLTLISIEIDGRRLTETEFKMSDDGLTVFHPPPEFEIRIVNENKPQENTELAGLYASGPFIVTQCEPESFRRITYFFDRPDVMTNYTVTIEADKKKYPVLLSNGDRISSRQLDNGRHSVTWKDPFKKPCYLFALVAGDLAVIKDSFITRSGRVVNLEIYAEHGKEHRCTHAMHSLKRAMKWDEQRFGREYDLSTYMIVSIDDFNAGAMENKGLNIFNSRLVHGDSKTATDFDYFMIESVVAHEYFHNWTGNRVTLRDWFHLSLKEGLTVFRDQEFSMDQSSRAMIRIDNVNDLRESQFAEDAGPNAHPIRPSSCYAVDNFFTATIYEKGAEIIRMMQTMVGRPGFRKGMDLYFERHDGQAVIIEDFAAAIADANNQKWDQFKLWYSQAGTPQLHVREKYDETSKTYELEIEQSCPPTPKEREESVEKKPFHIPLAIGLLSSKTGEEWDVRSSKATKNTEGQSLIHLKEQKETFTFTDVPHRPLLSLNREFSAPVHLKMENTFSDLLMLAQHDSDAFNRWESMQKIYLTTYGALIANDAKAANRLSEVGKAFRALSAEGKIDCDLKAKLLTLPSIDYLAQLESVLSAKTFLAAKQEFEKTLAQSAEKELLAIYKQYHGKNIDSVEPKVFGERRLKNLALSYLGKLPQHGSLIEKQFIFAGNMTDEQSAFAIALDFESSLRQTVTETFFERWKNESLVLNKWFALQAASHHPDTFSTVVKLWDHPHFSKTNPNRVYSLIVGFGHNLLRFHDPDQDTYIFMADKVIELDKINPQVATRVAGVFDIWIKLPPGQKERAHRELERMERAGLSKNTYEIISNSLKA